MFERNFIAFLHLYRIVYCWLYQLTILFAYRFLYPFFSPGTKALLDHEYEISTRNGASLTQVLPRLWVFYSLLVLPLPNHSEHSSDPRGTLTLLSRVHAIRIDTPSSAFLRIINLMHRLSASPHLIDSLNSEVQYFWRRGITGASKPDHFLLGHQWHLKDLADPREHLGNDPLLCAIAASTAEQMVEAFNWRIGLGLRRDLTLIKAKKPYWDKNLVPCIRESAPKWCQEVGPAPVTSLVDREGDEDMVRRTLESRPGNLSPSFRKRNLLASPKFLYFA